MSWEQNGPKQQQQLCEAMCESGEIGMCHLVFLWLHISCAWHKVWALYAMLAWPASQHRLCDAIPSIPALSTTWSIDPWVRLLVRSGWCFHPSIHPSIHPHSLRPDRVWACLPAVRWRRGPEEDRTNTRELECIGDGKIEIGIGDQLRQLISQVLSFPSLLCISFVFFGFLGFSVCLGISFATLSRAFFDLLSFSAVSLSPFLNFQGAVSIIIAIKSSGSCTCLWIFFFFLLEFFSLAPLDCLNWWLLSTPALIPLFSEHIIFFWVSFSTFSRASLICSRIGFRKLVSVQFRSENRSESFVNFLFFSYLEPSPCFLGRNFGMRVSCISCPLQFLFIPAVCLSVWK